MKIFDVTVPIANDMVVYPGDPPTVISRKSEIGKESARYNLSCFSFGSHCGTHIDPPLHFLRDGLSVDRLEVELLIGRARVVEINAARIDREVLEEFDLTSDSRLLFKTRNSHLWTEKRFVEDFVYVTPDGARKLVEGGIKVVGIDYLSIEKFGADEPETHLTLLEAGTIIVEGLDLRKVEPGEYEMICLPLRIENGDGSPARVLLCR